MATSAQKRQDVPFNRRVFKWARERRGRSYEDAAKGVNVAATKIAEWESGESKPTVRQARLLAEVYKRPFLEFFAKDLPDVAETRLVPDFRMHKDAPSAAEKIGLIDIQSWAETQRLNALDLYEILGDDPPGLPDALHATTSVSPVDAAGRTREILDFPISQQMGLSSSDRGKLPRILRTKIEAVGALVLRNSALSEVGVRGVCIYSTPLPIIVFGSEAPGAQAFTLAHELGHVALGESAISSPTSDRAGTTRTEIIERWCNRFAGALLVPKSALVSIFGRPDRPARSIDDGTLASLAARFAISRHAMLIRLVDIGYVDADFYWRVKHPIFAQEEADYKAGGRSTYYGSRFRSSSGDLYTGLVLEAWSNGRITNHNAAEFMGIKNLAHLEAIRDNFGK
jgi:Zn-dependent peptidase ImmA (M78 family)/transcriptional regulator with XRE-family HTH domain